MFISGTQAIQEVSLECRTFNIVAVQKSNAIGEQETIKVEKLLSSLVNEPSQHFNKEIRLMINSVYNYLNSAGLIILFL